MRPPVRSPADWISYWGSRNSPPTKLTSAPDKLPAQYYPIGASVRYKGHSGVVTAYYWSEWHGCAMYRVKMDPGWYIDAVTASERVLKAEHDT